MEASSWVPSSLISVFRPWGRGHVLAALGRDLLVQHRPPRLALGGLDQMADLLPLLHVVDEVEGGVVHLVKLIHLQHPLNNPGEVIHDVAVFPVKGRLPLGDEVQVEVPPLVMGDAVRQARVHAKADLVGNQRLVEHIPGELLPSADGREDDHPGVELI